MSRDNAPKYNIETINTKTNTVTKLVRSFRNDKDGDNGTQTIEQPSLLLSNVVNSANKIQLQDSLTGKTVHIKTITKDTGDKVGPHLQQVHFVPTTKTLNMNTQTRPQIVYIKSNNMTTNTIQRLPVSTQNLMTGIVRPLNKISIIKPKVSGLTNPMIITSVANNTTTSLINNDIKTPLHDTKNTDKIETVMIACTSASASGPKILGLSMKQKSDRIPNIALSNVLPQMQSKGPVYNFQISDGKINHNTVTVSSSNCADDTKAVNLPPLQPIRKDMGVVVRSSNSIKMENSLSLKTTDANVQVHVNNVPHGFTSILKKQLISNKKMVDVKKETSSESVNNNVVVTTDDKVNNKVTVENSNQLKLIKTENSDKLKPIKIENSDKVNPIKIEKPEETEIIKTAKPDQPQQIKTQPRIKKQHLKVKEDKEEAMCIQVLKPKHYRDIKRKPKVGVKKFTKDFIDNPMKNLMWKNGIGTLDNTNLHFKKNEFGLFDLLSDLEYDALITGRKDSKYYTPLAKRVEIQNNVKKSTSADDLYECYTCGSTGPAIEFISPEFCSTVCADIYEDHRFQVFKNFDADSPNSQKRSQIVISDDSDSDGEGKNFHYSWMPTATRAFSWSKYMGFKKTKPAPIKLFKEPFPFHYNSFKIGMKLEGIDPKHESYICVMSVVDVKGYRICLHFDSYSAKYDFWVNADCVNIFPPGWCERNNYKLKVPKHYTSETFIWTTYLRQCRSIAAPKVLFPHVAFETVCPLAFRIGMKLEALDRKNSKKMCVATITDVLVTQRFLVHFDGWDEMYDYWADATSPYIHPVGWCKEQKEPLLAPPGYNSDKPFNWKDYLSKTKSIPVPARAFKARPMPRFQVGMKLEAVDPRVPYLIRVATVAEVKDTELKISFDGWPPRYSFWAEANSPDIHPVGWCAKTGHHIEPPLMPEDVEVSLSIGCGVPGCNGQGNINNHLQSKHATIALCPYAPKNLNLFLEAGWDRLKTPGEEGTVFSTNILSKATNKRKNSSGNQSGIKRIRPNTGSSKNETTSVDNSKNTSTNLQSCKKDSNPPCNRSVGSIEKKSDQANPEIKDIKKTDKDQKKSSRFVHSSVFKPQLNSTSPDIDRNLWLKYTKPLSYLIKKSHKESNPKEWSSQDVADFVKNIPNCSEYAQIFVKQNIDGECFTMLSAQDLITYCKLHIGPAIKIYNSIMILREQL